MTDVPHSGFVTDRLTAESLWDRARRDVRREVEEEWREKVRELEDAHTATLAEIHSTTEEREHDWRRLVALLEQPKNAARGAEITGLKATLGYE